MTVYTMFKTQFTGVKTLFTNVKQSGQEEVHGEEKPQNDQELEQEVEVTTEATTEVVQPQGNVLLNFPPINPDNVNAEEDLNVFLDLEQYLPQASSTPNRPGKGNTNPNQAPAERQLHVVDIQAEFPRIPNTMFEKEREETL